MPWHAVNVLALLAFGAVLILGVVFAWILVKRNDRRQAKHVGLALAMWTAAYLVTVLVVSARSFEMILPLGNVKRFCGFYLDCHMGVRVFDVQTTESVGSGDGLREARGMFYVVTVFVESDAVRATLQLHAPEATVKTDGPTVYRRDTAAEAALGRDTSLSQPVEAGDQHPVTLVFDLPDDATNPRLLVTEPYGLWPDQLLELVLVGDEDSMFHQKTTLALVGAADWKVLPPQPPAPSQ